MFDELKTINDSSSPSSLNRFRIELRRDLAEAKHVKYWAKAGVTGNLNPK
jgi:hypothetical protein